MNHSIINSVAGMRALQQRIDTLANNVANVDTNGFKRRDTTFSSLFARELQNQPKLEEEAGRLTPYHIRPGSGSRAVMTRYDYTPGNIERTNVPTHFAMEGPAFFQVQHRVNDDPDNPQYELRFTRDGSFTLDATRQLVTSQGDLVLDANGEPIIVPENHEFQVADKADGQAYIQFVNPNDPGETIDDDRQLGVFYIRNPQALESVGDNQYVIPEELFDNPDNRLAITNQYVDALTGPNAIVAPDGINWAVRQGSLETSNVDMIKEMTALMETQRTYQMSAKAISFTDRMMGITNDLKV